jgi:hypothetical protein
MYLQCTHHRSDSAPPPSPPANTGRKSYLTPRYFLSSFFSDQTSGLHVLNQEWSSKLNFLGQVISLVFLFSQPNWTHNFSSLSLSSPECIIFFIFFQQSWTSPFSCFFFPQQSGTRHFACILSSLNSPGRVISLVFFLFSSLPINTWIASTEEVSTSCCWCVST